MQLDYKKTIKVGIAFFIITIFWTTYDTVIARILVDKFGLNHFWSGVVMALDNILAVFLLPLFGSLSDKSNAKIGKRTSYILVGTIVAAFAFIGLTFADNLQSKNIHESDVKIEQIYQDALGSGDVDGASNHYQHWNNLQITHDLKDEEGNYIFRVETIPGFTTENINSDKEIDAKNKYEIKQHLYDYLNQEAYKVTKSDYKPFILFVVLLFVAIFMMGIFRSPAVALMPDVTIKPLRSKGNAIINLMGSFSAIVALLLLMITKRDSLSYVSYSVVFIPIGITMLFALGLFMLLVKENDWVLEKVALEKELGIEEEIEEEGADEKLPKDKLKSLLLILFSVFFWFMGYNAVISKVSVYAPRVLNMGSAFPTMIAQGVAILAFIPIGILSSKIGRKKMILMGIIILAVSFGTVTFLNETTGFIMYLNFAFVGIGWATINVNSYPMVVELAKGSNTGKYTGYYYTFSMSAQIFTPMISGLLMDKIGDIALFPYAAAFVLLSFVTMFFVKHGDQINIEKRSLLESFDVED